MVAPRLQLIASRESCPALLESLQAALGAVPRGGVLVQLREKATPAAALLTLARALLPICREAGAPLVINDRVDVALAAGLDGVHLPGDGLSPLEARALLGPDALIGVSCHTLDEVLRASARGADSCVFGPIFAVPGKGQFGPPAPGNSGDTKSVGTAPNGQPLYAAAWYREPYDSELAGYLSTADGPAGR